MYVDLDARFRAFYNIIIKFVAVRLGSSRKDHNALLPPGCRALNKQSLVIFVLAPVALPTKNPFQTHTIAVTNIQFGVGHCGTCCQMYPIRRSFQFMGKSEDIVYRLASTHRTLGHIEHAALALPDVLLMLVRKAERYGLFGGIPIVRRHKYPPRSRSYPQLQNCYR